MHTGPDMPDFLEGSSHYFGSAIQSPYPQLIFYSQTAATVSALCMTYGLGITNLSHVSFRRTTLVSLPCEPGRDRVFPFWSECGVAWKKNDRNLYGARDTQCRLCDLV